MRRSRRLRETPLLRSLVRETRLRREQLVMPYFVRSGKGVQNPIASMPGQFQWSVDLLVGEIQDAARRGVGAVLLFGIPDRKDARGTEACNENGIVPTAVRAIKSSVPNVVVVTDVCLCAYTDHGHCGVARPVRKNPIRESQARSADISDLRDLSNGVNRTMIDNDATLELLQKMAVVHAQAGADMVAPSAMMDGQVRAIRQGLDAQGFSNTPVMSYSAKYASTFYGPFRDAAESPPKFGDRTSYQMDSSNVREAMREIEQDLSEEADIVMVKPALPYLDVIRVARDRFDCPIAAYSVSGEYSMVKAAAQAGWLDEKKAAMEILSSIQRAGADIVITYWAKEAATWIM